MSRSFFYVRIKTVIFYTTFIFAVHVTIQVFYFQINWNRRNNTIAIFIMRYILSGKSNFRLCFKNSIMFSWCLDHAFCLIEIFWSVLFDSDIISFSKWCMYSLIFFQNAFCDIDEKCFEQKWNNKSSGKYEKIKSSICSGTQKLLLCDQTWSLIFCV